MTAIDLDLPHLLYWCIGCLLSLRWLHRLVVSTRCRQRLRWRRKVNCRKRAIAIAAPGKNSERPLTNIIWRQPCAEGGHVSVSLGDYTGAVKAAEEAVKFRRALHENGKMGTDLNTIGLAYQYQGNYAAALEHYQER
jgi:tetratricopeptide (TPR) repeat protein